MNLIAFQAAVDKLSIVTRTEIQGGSLDIYLFFSYYGEDHRSLPEEEEMEALDVLAASYGFRFKSAVHSGAVPSVNGTSHEKWLYTPM